MSDQNNQVHSFFYVGQTTRKPQTDDKSSSYINDAFREDVKKLFDDAAKRIQSQAEELKPITKTSASP